MGGCTPGVRASEGVDKGEVWMISHEIRTNACLRIGYRLAGFCHFSLWAPWWMLLGRHFHWMMGNEAGA